MRVDLPGGHWVELLDPMAVTERQMRPLRAAQLATSRALQPPPAPGRLLPDHWDPEDEDSPPLPPHLSAEEALELIGGFDQEVMAFCVVGWSLPVEPSAAACGELPVPIYRAIQESMTAIVDELFPRHLDQLVEDIATSFSQPLVVPLLELPDWVGEAKRLLEVVELTHWTIEQVDDAPAVRLQRLLVASRARHKAAQDEIDAMRSKNEGT